MGQLFRAARELRRNHPQIIPEIFPLAAKALSNNELPNDVRVIEDAGSKNGVFVNGSRAKKPVKLRNGDKVGFGPSEFVFETAWTADDWDGMHVIDLSKKSSDGMDSEGPGKRRWQAEVVRSWTVSDAIAGEWWNWQTRKI